MKFSGVEPCLSYIFLGHDRQLVTILCLLMSANTVFFWLQAVAEEEGLYQAEVVTSEAKALEAVVLTMEAEATEGAS